MKVLITGATGFIGRSTLIALAKAGHELRAVTRREGSVSDLPCKAIVWDSNSDDSSSLCEHLKNIDTIIHLAGEPVANSRWSKSKKDLIWSSRIDSTKKIVDAVASLPPDQRPKSFICASAIGYYGNRNDEVVSESSTVGQGFLAEVVSGWETEARKFETLGIRSVQLRIGVVLGRDGGALELMKPITLGTGKQWMSWIHLTDLVRLIQFCVENPKAEGPINAVSLEPAQNITFTQLLAEARSQKALFALPAAFLKSALGEMSHVLLDSTRVTPEMSTHLGFTFSFPKLKGALQDIVGNLKPGEMRFSAVQFVPKSKSEVFDFFSKAENIETITPPWLNFRIIRKSTPSIEEGSLIDYQLKIHAVPIRWRTRIEEWTPSERFVDTQLKGPYKRWHHTHRFEEIPGGTLMWDEVIYQLPGGPLGSLVGQSMVKKDVSSIFAYRKKKIFEIFGKT